MEGGRWNRQKRCIDESIPQVFYDQMPIIMMTPTIKTQNTDKEDENYCEIPVYRTLNRHGVCNKIGQSTNFVTYIKLKIDESTTVNHWISRGVALFCQLND